MLGSSSCHLVQNNPATPSGPPWSGRWCWSVPPRPPPGWASVAATSPAWPAPARFPRCAPARTTTTSRVMWHCRHGAASSVGRAWPIARRMRASAWRAIGRARKQRQQHTTSGGRRTGLLPHAANNGWFSWICVLGLEPMTPPPHMPPEVGPIMTEMPQHDQPEVSHRYYV